MSCFYYSCLEVVFQSYCYSEGFYSVKSDLFPCIGKKICLVLFIFGGFFELYCCSLSAFSNAVSIYAAVETPFFE